MKYEYKKPTKLTMMMAKKKRSDVKTWNANHDRIFIEILCWYSWFLYQIFWCFPFFFINLISFATLLFLWLIVFFFFKLWLFLFVCVYKCCCCSFITIPPLKYPTNGYSASGISLILSPPFRPLIIMRINFYDT